MNVIRSYGPKLLTLSSFSPPLLFKILSNASHSPDFPALIPTKQIPAHPIPVHSNPFQNPSLPPSQLICTTPMKIPHIIQYSSPPILPHPHPHPHAHPYTKHSRPILATKFSLPVASESHFYGEFRTISHTILRPPLLTAKWCSEKSCRATSFYKDYVCK